MWSQLINQPVGYYAENIMRRRNGYHNWDHILSMFDFLEKDNFPYDINLDAAILYHDSVYDELSDKEMRSIELFLDYANLHTDKFNEILTNKVCLLIVDTINHKITLNTSELSKAIIRADLHQLANGKHTFLNYTKIMNESIQLYKIDEFEFAKKNIEFMNQLKKTCNNNLIFDDKKYDDFWNNVVKGIDDTITISNIILRK